MKKIDKKNHLISINNSILLGEDLGLYILINSIELGKIIIINKRLNRIRNFKRKMWRIIY
jgi:hypothetical protein